MKRWQHFCFAIVLTLQTLSFGRDVITNQVQFNAAPPWLNEGFLQETIDRVQNVLEWDLRKIIAYGYVDEAQFNSQHKLKFAVDAVFRRNDSSIHLSPRVTQANFTQVFGHELVHAIFYQKHKQAIPQWLEEGLANYIGKQSSPDYVWLVKQTWGDVTTMGHPNSGAMDPRVHYSVSTALIEMISGKCTLRDLLQLSVGSKMTTYLKTYCEINDLNESFKKWVEVKSRQPISRQAAQSPSSDASSPWWKKKKEAQWWEKKK